MELNLGIKKLNSEMNISVKNKKLCKFENNIKEIYKTSTTLYRSLSFNLPRNFVPQIKPKKSIICPSPMTLNKKSNFFSNKINEKKIDNLNDFSLSLEEDKSSFTSSSEDLNEVNNYNDYNNSSNKDLSNSLSNSISNLRKSLGKIKSQTGQLKFKEAEEMIQNNLILNTFNINSLDNDFDWENTNYNNLELFRKSSFQNKGNSILNVLQMTSK
jgi:hypothetical protein